MTPLIEFDNVFLKREDMNTTGSAKDRAMELQVENLVKQGFSEAVISSTGNAAISAKYFCDKAGVKLTVFVAPRTSPDKLKLITNYIISSKPISDAFKYAKQNNAYNLRQSTDSTALEGYSVIGKELTIQSTSITSIFIPVGSGTTLLGISKTLKSTVKIFAVQPASNPTITATYDHDFSPENYSITDALTVRSLPLKNLLLKAINLSNGGGIVVQDDTVKDCHQKLLDNGFNVSPEAGLALAGYNKIKDTVDCGSHPVILVTGTLRQ